MYGCVLLFFLLCRSAASAQMCLPSGADSRSMSVGAIAGDSNLGMVVGACGDYQITPRWSVGVQGLVGDAKGFYSASAGVGRRAERGGIVASLFFTRSEFDVPALGHLLRRAVGIGLSAPFTVFHRQWQESEVGVDVVVGAVGALQRDDNAESSGTSDWVDGVLGGSASYRLINWTVHVSAQSEASAGFSGPRYAMRLVRQIN